MNTKKHVSSKNGFSNTISLSSSTKKNNVICEIKKNHQKDGIVFCAHIDTVFPDTEGFHCKELNGRLYAPSVGDDTANVAQLMLITRYIYTQHLKEMKDCFIVFNSCEEGLGNLEGTRYFMETYKDQIREFYSFDLTYKEIIAKAVGSLRYKVIIHTEGGHSYSAFGNPNAIAIASDLIHQLYKYKVPNHGRSTYNVGKIEGGTSVNTIAQNASFLFEYRSDSRDDLYEMKSYFDSLIQSFRNLGYSIEVKTIGERPCMGDVDTKKMEQIVQRAVSTIQYFYGHAPQITSGSTDCNIPYSLGLCGCCLGGYIGEGEHTYEEWIDLSSLEVGMNILIHFVLNSLINT